MEKLIWFDYLMMFIMVVPMVLGVIRGFIRAIFALTGMVLGLGLSVPFSRPLGNFLLDLFGFQYVFTGRILAFCLIFIGCWIAGLIAGRLLRKMIDLLKLRWIDRILGLLLGSLKGGLILTALIIVFYVTPQLHSTLERSVFAPPLVRTAKIGVSLLPPAWQYYLNPERWIGISRYKVLN